jgi:4-carboxymuconolactone decarboxylase
MNERERHKKGMKVRKKVLGKEHVERAESGKNSFNEPFQDLITRYAWGEVWARPGIPKKTRSMLTIAMMVALNRTEELRLHLRAAANAGVSREEICEVLLQTAIYCGVPAANHAFLVAEEVFAESRGGKS